LINVIQCEKRIRHALSQFTTRSGTSLPLRWMAPESLLDNCIEYSYATDVWSFGVLIWEMFTLGIPYGVLLDPTNAFGFVHSGGILSSPPYCPAQLWSIVTECFEKNPLKRPSFRDIVMKIQKILDEDKFLDEKIPLNEVQLERKETFYNYY